MKKEDMVKLISAEGFEFVIDKDAAMVSQTIYNMLTSPGLLSLSLPLPLALPHHRLQLGFHSRSFLYCFIEIYNSFQETKIETFPPTKFSSNIYDLCLTLW